MIDNNQKYIGVNENDETKEFDSLEELISAGYKVPRYLKIGPFKDKEQLADKLPIEYTKLVYPRIPKIIE